MIVVSLTSCALYEKSKSCLVLSCLVLSRLFYRLFHWDFCDCTQEKNGSALTLIRCLNVVLDYVFAFVFHNDSLKLLDFLVSSVTPILAFNSCLPLAVRLKFEAMICLSIFPRSPKNIEMLSVPIIAGLKVRAVNVS